MKRLSFLALLLAVLSFAFFILLVFVRIPLPAYPLMSHQDAADLLTALVLLPLYWLLFRFAAGGAPGLAEEMAFMAFAAIWVTGHGIHLSANSVNNLAEALARARSLDITGTSIYQLGYFYDEHLSHWLWHTGLLGLAGLLLWREWRRPAGEETVWWAAVIGGLVYGFTLFSLFLEGQTVWLGFPFAIAVTLGALIWGRARLGRQPLLAFFGLACLVACLLLSVWAVYWGGFPQFTDVGLI